MYLCGNQISGAPRNLTHWLISTQACSAGSGTNVAHSSSVLGYVARQEPSLTTERACEQFLRKVASCWWRGENGSDDVKRDVFQCFVGERVLPLLACTRKDVPTTRDDLEVDASTLRVVRDHDMALRCLFAAYCQESTECVPLLGVLHFARDFRLLTAGRFPPAIVVDCARSARHARHPKAMNTSLRWPEFVEALLRLAQSSDGDESLAEKTRKLLQVMDPTGRVFKRGTDVEVEATATETDDSTVEEPLSRTNDLLDASDAVTRRAQATRAAAAQCLAAAADATLQLAAASGEEAQELRAIADGMAVAARAAARRGVARPPPLPRIEAPPLSPEPSEREWPPPSRKSADELWRSPRGASSPPPPPKQKKVPPIDLSEATVEEKAEEPDHWWWVDRVDKPVEAARHVGATAVQSHCRGFLLRKRLARLVEEVATSQKSESVEEPEEVQEEEEEPIKSEEEVVQSQQEACTEDERAVIHAFALAALLGDGSPRRIARARVLVETLKKLPDVEDGGEAVVAALDKAGDLHVDEDKPTLEKLEVALRDALSRVAVAEKFNPAAARDARVTAERLGAAVRRHPGFWARRAAADAAWEARERPANRDALAAMRKLVPRDVRNMRVEEVAAFLGGRVGLHSDDARLKPLAKRIVDQKILWLVHHDPARTAKIHIADLRSRYMYHDLDAVELRAVYAALPSEFEHDEDNAKQTWRRDVRRKLEDSVKKCDAGDSRAGHPAYDVLSTATRPPTPPPQESTDVSAEASDASGPVSVPKRVASAGTLESALSFEDLMEKQGPFRAASPVPPPQQEEKPPDWRECYDANYKRTYFFNVASGESRWRAPDDRYVPYEKPIEGPVRAQSVDPAALKMAAERVKRSLSESAMPFVAEHG